MKTILLASLLFGSLASGFSQTQEVKLMDRIMKPDRELGNPLQNKSFAETISVPLRSSPAAGQGFYGTRDVTVKEFSTRSFLGLKNPWFGSKVFATKVTASMPFYDVKSAGFNKTANATAFYAGTKTASLGSPVVPVTTFVPEPASQGSVTRISDKINDKMTIDEVRELLNKNR